MAAQAARAARPAWLPAEFETPEALVAAYHALLSDGAGPAAGGSHPSARGCDFAACEKEYHEKGALSEATYRQLEEVGVPRGMVDRYIDGQRALADQFRREVLDELGGEQAFDALRGWAASTLSPEALNAYEAAMGGDPEQARLAIRGMRAAYERANGRPPQLVTGHNHGRMSDRFANLQEVAAAMSDPRYKREESYRQAVIDKIARSKLR